MNTTARDAANCIAAAQCGDAASFDHLVREFAPRVHRFLVATGLPRHDADDITQETFIRAHQHLRNFDGRASFTTWLFTIGHRLRLSWLARERKHGLLSDVEPAVDAPESVADAGSIWATAKKALSERHFQALWLRYGEDCDIPDIARVLNTTRINVKVMLHRARRTLAKLLDADGNEAKQPESAKAVLL